MDDATPASPRIYDPSMPGKAHVVSGAPDKRYADEVSLGVGLTAYPRRYDPGGKRGERGSVAWCGEPCIN